MPVGATARRVLGPAFPAIGAAYRRVFVDVRKVAAAIPNLGPEAILLDVGGGDGAILNHLLDIQPALRVVAVDLAGDIGQMIRADLADRVELRPQTSVADWVAEDHPAVTAAFLSDVLHHVPRDQHEGLVADIVAAFRGRPVTLIIKDIIPAGTRSKAAFLADWYISGDRAARPISPVELVDLVGRVLPGATVEVTGLSRVDYPNYCLVFRGTANATQS